MLDTVRSNLTEVFRAQPLALGAIGLAIGAGIAAALPPTEVEATYLGETSDAVKAKATEVASEQADHATKVAGAVIGAVSEEARRQGLTMERGKIRSWRYLGKNCPRGRCGWQGNFAAIDSEIFVGIAVFYTSILKAMLKLLVWKRRLGH